MLHGRGELLFAFAVPGGWGDIAVATGALGIVLLVPDLPARRPWIMAWNVLGLADILFVVATATRLALFCYSAGSGRNRKGRSPDMPASIIVNIDVHEPVEPNAQQALAWWDSPEYRPVRAIRQRTARNSMILVEGVESQG